MPRCQARASQACSWHPVAALALALLVTSCIEVAKPKAADDIEVKEVATSEGMTLERACVPSGIELCFDALDNNCNGVIDEGAECDDVDDDDGPGHGCRRDNDGAGDDDELLDDLFLPVLLLGLGAGRLRRYEV